jgi:hypothetical protein
MPPGLIKANPILPGMRDRIWAELAETVFNMYYLNLYISRQRRIATIVQFAAIIFSFGSIAGWYKFEQYSKVWAIILVLAQLIDLFRAQFLTDEVELSKLNTLQFFYTECKTELEQLFVSLSTGRLTENQAEKKFAVLQVKEIETMKMLDHKQVKNHKRLNKLASSNRNKYLAKIK